MMSADGVPYHNTCFRCSHCNGRLTMSSYSAVDGKLYCKPHFEQLFKETGSFTTKKFQPCDGGGRILPQVVLPVRSRRLQPDDLIVRGAGRHPLLQAPLCAALQGGSYTHLTKTASLKKNALAQEAGLAGPDDQPPPPENPAELEHDV
ncbi:UNVERIFIED_CONTAM: LIM domain-containing protein PLIM2b [Sesamum radiatum]|uniref:LIM domain-containing protein PLIM2b n=1 Tax=Sesamum radiatum TaxID=300843 RepID=A0AAW2L1E2_SESRA